jgi:hypothetical protein
MDAFLLGVIIGLIGGFLAGLLGAAGLANKFANLCKACGVKGG